MKLLFYILIFCIFLLIVLLTKNSRLNMFMTLLCSIVIIKIILNPDLCIKSTLNSTKLFFNSVFISLFPFLIITNIMIEYNGVNIYSKFLGNILCKPFNLPNACSFPIIISFICGYPLGAKYSCDLYKDHLIDYPTLEKMINIASNASPLFIIGSVGAYMLNNYHLGYLILISNYISCIIMAIILKNRGKKPLLNIKNNINLNSNKNLSSNNIGKILKNSVENSFYTSISIGGFIILFSVLVELVKHDFLYIKFALWFSNLLHIPYNLLNGFIIGILEMTNGCNSISMLHLNLPFKIALISFFLSFGGLSITSQIYSFTYKFNLPMKKYLNRKILQGFICSIVSLILYKIFYNKINFTVNLLYNPSYLRVSTIKLFMFLILLILIPYINEKIKNLFSVS